jgi:hypothetical protein
MGDPLPYHLRSIINHIIPMANIQTQNWLMPRRSFLRGAGATLALPFLDAMRPLMAAGKSGSLPVRIALLYMPNGADDGMTRDEVQAIWDAAKDQTGYAAVNAFLAALRAGGKP